MDDAERKALNNAKAREYRANNREKCRERSRKWYAANKAKGNACSVAWQKKNAKKYRQYRLDRYQKNRDRLLADFAKWRKENPKKMKAAHDSWRSRNKDRCVETSRKWYEANKDKSNRSSKAWREANPEAKRAHYHTRRSRTKNAEGSYIGADLKAIFAAQKGKCAYCRCIIVAGYDIDHIVPLSRGGTNWPRNIQLTCESCNQKKHASDPVDFARKLGRLI